MRRAIVYLDSRNIAHMFEKNGIDPFNFNYRGWVEHLVVGNKGSYRKIDSIKFFGAKYPSSLDIHKYNRDEILHSNLRTNQNIEIHEGHFKISNESHKAIAIEKGVDVKIAVEVIADCVRGKFDDCYVFSTDTDLIYAIRQCKDLGPSKKFYVFCERTLKEWKQVADSVMVVHMDTAKKFNNHHTKPALTSLNDLKSKFNLKP